MEVKGYFGYGVLHKSDEFEEWERSQGSRYAIYRSEWGNRVENLDPGPTPLSINLEMTTKCNLACSFCTNPTLQKNQVLDLDNKILYSAIKTISDYSIPAVNMNGLGESLLRRDFSHFARLIKKEAGVIDLMVHTNCTVMNIDLADELIESGMDKMIFSVDSPIKKTYEQLRIRRNKSSINASTLSKEEYFNAKTDIDLKGALWEETITNVLIFRARRILKNRITPLIRATMILLDDTQEQVDYFFSFWKGIADQITLQDLAWQTKLLNDGKLWQNKQKHSAIDAVDLLVEEYKASGVKFHCPALYQAAWILTTGNVNPCSNPNARLHMQMGSLESQTLEEIWHGEKYKELRTLHDEGKWYENSYCRNCDKAHVEVTNLLEKSIVGTANAWQNQINTKLLAPDSTKVKS